jgi:hypothetical protein
MGSLPAAAGDGPGAAPTRRQTNRPEQGLSTSCFAGASLSLFNASPLGRPCCFRSFEWLLKLTNFKEFCDNDGAMTTRLLLFFLGFMILGWSQPESAFAYIPHWDPKEGFFIRQFSYLFFLFAMLFFFYELKQETLHKKPGFRSLALASGFFALWNLDCFLGQFVALNLGEPAVLKPAGIFSQRLVMTGPGIWVYYLTKLDHLLLVPAFLFLYNGIRALARSRI